MILALSEEAQDSELHGDVQPRKYSGRLQADKKQSVQLNSDPWSTSSRHCQTVQTAAHTRRTLTHTHTHTPHRHTALAILRGGSQRLCPTLTWKGWRGAGIGGGGSTGVCHRAYIPSICVSKSARRLPGRSQRGLGVTARCHTSRQRSNAEPEHEVDTCAQPGWCPQVMGGRPSC